jgi:hypothetical protein
MPSRRYDKLPVWQPAISLARKALRLTREPVLRRHPEFVNRFEGAALAVGNHIAAGVADGREEVLIDRICKACAATGKFRAMLAVLDNQPDAESEETEVGRLKVLSRRLEQYLQAWSAKLRGVPLPRDQSEAQEDQKAFADEDLPLARPAGAKAARPEDPAAALAQAARSDSEDGSNLEEILASLAKSHQGEANPFAELGGH